MGEGLMGRASKGLSESRKRRTQNFVSLVSVYSSQLGVVLATQPFESKTNSELRVVQTLLKTLQLGNVVFTMDALFLSKKTRMVKLAGEKARLEVSCKQNILFSDEPSWQGLALNPQQFAKQCWNASSKPVQVVEVRCGTNTTTTELS